MSPARKLMQKKPLTPVLAVVVVAALGAVAVFVAGTQSATATPKSTSSPVVAQAPQVAKKVTAPPVNGKFDYQLGGAYAPPKGVRIVTRDRTAKAAKGRYNICYVNAFQVQPDEESWWKKKHPNLLLKDSNGDYVVDEDWDELMLDTSTAAKRKQLAAIMGTWFDGCATKGFKAVEPDNLDSYTRSGKLLTKADALAFAKLLAARAHKAGLAIGQKNTVELGKAGKKSGFDFAVTEECGRYDECGGYTKVYGRHVIVIEYTKKAFTKTCKAHGSKLSVVRRDLDVSPKGSKGYVYQAC